MAVAITALVAPVISVHCEPIDVGVTRIVVVILVPTGVLGQRPVAVIGVPNPEDVRRAGRNQIVDVAISVNVAFGPVGNIRVSVTG